MTVKIVKYFTIALFACALTLSGSAMAAKGGKPNKPDVAAKADDKGKNHDDEVFGIGDKDASIIIDVLKHIYNDDEEVTFTRPSRDFCPPGLARKNNGCMPPGQAKKYRIGEPLGDNVGYSNIPEILSDALGLPPKGKKYVRVDNDVLLITEGTKLVLDAIGVNR